MIVNALVLGLFYFSIGFIAFSPWLLMLSALQEHRKGLEGPNPIGTAVCAFLCLYEVAATIDWLTGHTSHIF